MNPSTSQNDKRRGLQSSSPLFMLGAKDPAHKTINTPWHLMMEPHGLSPWYLHKNTLVRPWAPKRFGAQAPRLRRVIRQWRNPPKQ